MDEAQESTVLEWEYEFANAMQDLNCHDETANDCVPDTGTQAPHLSYGGG